MRKIFFLMLILFIFIRYSAAQETPHTVEIITARGEAVFPVSFFNDGQASTYTASLENSLVAVLQTTSITVPSEEFGSFNLIIGNENVEKGIYFDSLTILRDNEPYQEIPIIVGLESRNSEIEYDVSIDFNPSTDISIISGETVLSPMVNVYKLNYNPPVSNGVALTFAVYSIDGELLTESSEVVSVSTQASYEHFFNLESNPPNEVLVAVKARSHGA
jgi:hypothetical protein